MASSLALQNPPGAKERLHRFFPGDVGESAHALSAVQVKQQVTVETTATCVRPRLRPPGMRDLGALLALPFGLPPIANQ